MILSVLRETSATSALKLCFFSPGVATSRDTQDKLSRQLPRTFAIGRAWSRTVARIHIAEALSYRRVVHVR